MGHRVRPLIASPGRPSTWLGCTAGFVAGLHYWFYDWSAMSFFWMVCMASLMVDLQCWFYGWFAMLVL
jgi:hypothetical protein